MDFTPTEFFKAVQDYRNEFVYPPVNNALSEGQSLNLMLFAVADCLGELLKEKHGDNPIAIKNFEDIAVAYMEDWKNRLETNS